ncbi:Alpha/Beta hydrolase protein [Gorgonomyces haynaldii]|nr:Alpha/Beta hydrolase protein [Gorgonomyces haynaldii]
MLLSLENGLDLDYDLYNSKSSVDNVLIIPGLFQTKQDWRPVASTMKKNVCAINLRGTGQSTLGNPIPPFTNPPEINVMQLASDVFEIISHLKWTRFSVLGSCIGGAIAVQLGLLMRGRDDMSITELVFVNASVLCPSQGSNLVTTIGKALESVKDGCLDAQFMNSLSLSNQKVSPFQTSHSILEEYLFMIQDLNLTDQLQHLSIKSTVLHTTGNKMIAVHYGQMISEQLGSKWIPFNGRDHWLHLTAPEVVAKLVS